MTRAEILADLKVIIGKGIEVSDGELYAWINDGYNQLVDEVIANNADFFSKSWVTSLVAGQSEYALPADFEKMIMVEVQVDGVWRRFQPVPDISYLGSPSQGSTYTLDDPHYYISGSNVGLDPAHSASITDGLKIKYVYTPTELTADNLSPAIPKRYHGLIKYWAYANYLDRDDEHVSAERMRQRFDAMVNKMKDNMFGTQIDESRSVQIINNIDMF
jgi:hypothetical protein